MRRYAMLCDAMICYGMECDAMRCYAIRYDGMRCNTVRYESGGEERRRDPIRYDAICKSAPQARRENVCEVGVRQKWSGGGAIVQRQAAQGKAMRYNTIPLRESQGETMQYDWIQSEGDAIRCDDTN